MTNRFNRVNNPTDGGFQSMGAVEATEHFLNYRNQMKRYYEQQGYTPSEAYRMAHDDARKQMARR